MTISAPRAPLVLVAAALVATGCGSTPQTTAPASRAADRPPHGPRRHPPSAPRHTDLAHPVTATLTPLRHLLTVAARVDGKGPYRFAIDTGSADMLRVSPRLARRLRLPRIGAALTRDPSGRHPVKTSIVRVGEVRIGAARFRGVDAAVGTRLGELAPDGIIGLGLFARLTATIDYPGHVLRLSRTPVPAGGDHVADFTREHGVPQIAITAGGKALPADLDTGGPAVLTVPTPRTVALQRAPRVVGRGRTATNEFDVRAAPLRGDLRVAGWRRRSPRVNVVDVLPVASIGAGFLHDYAVMFDMRDRHVALTRRASAAHHPSWRRLDAWLRRRSAHDRFAGAVLVAHHGRRVLQRAYGLADRARGTPNTLGTRFNIGSVGKTFTAVAIAQLAEQGRLAFDDPVDRYVPGLPAGITIAQLLTHTSGLGDVFMRWHPPAGPPLDVSPLIARIRREPLRFAPGSRFGYSNSGYVVLGAVVEAVTHQRYYDYVRRHVFAPAGMTHTGWYAPGQVPHLAHGYVPAGGGFADSRGAGTTGSPAGGAYSTVGDLLRFARALQQHRLLGAAMTDTLLSGTVRTPLPGTRYAYGFEDTRRNGLLSVGHGGGAPGIEAQLRIYPALGCTVVVLSNLDAAARPVSDHIARLLAR